MTAENVESDRAQAATILGRLAGYEPIALADMGSVTLLNRVEVKYVMPGHLLPDVLDALQQSYAVLEVKGHRLNRYGSLYFDTGDFAMYRRHHARAAERFKVRARTYMESESSFLEVKRKTNKNRVVKNRIETGELVTTLEGRSADFLLDICPYPAADMRPCLWNTYRRVTLVDQRMHERVTLDIDLHFDWQGRSIDFAGVVVAEVKQERFSPMSSFIRLMRQYQVRSIGFSKYCIGASIIYPFLKSNRFKAQHRFLAGLMKGGPYELH